MREDTKLMIRFVLTMLAAIAVTLLGMPWVIRGLSAYYNWVLP
jgi:hypothetical protein